MDIIEGKADMDRAKLPKISALDKIIVAVAGPVFSLLLALFFAGIYGCWSSGERRRFNHCRWVIMPGSPAEKRACNRAIKSCPWTANRSGVSWE